MGSSRLFNTIDEYKRGYCFLWGYDEKAGGQEMKFAPDSPEWFTWLGSLSSFCYKYEQQVRFTARREKQEKGQEQGTGYWYAYLKVRQKLFKRYLGKTEQLTITHLQQVSQELHEQALGYIPANTKLDTRAQRRQEPITESLTVGRLTFHWENNILKVRGLGDYETLSQRQAAELLSYLYDRRKSILS